MQRYDEVLPLDRKIIEKCVNRLPLACGKACFFDIETTGLSPQVSSLYLIGAGFIEENGFHLTQWFAEDYISEKEILASFADFVSTFDTLVTYNGATFDIPYLEKKYRAHTLPSPFPVKKNLDIYKEVRKKKSIFPTSNMKLATMERLLGFCRNDRYTGKDCIELYTEFMKKKYFRDTAADTLRGNLLLHNHDDIIGTFLCSQLMCFGQYKKQNPCAEVTTSSLVLTDSITTPVPFPVSFEKDNIQIRFSENKLHIEIPLFVGTLFHFYKDYKDYFYLPEEDMAVHKSVGIYVDAAHRQKATAANCYTKKEGTFLPLPKKFPIEDVTIFKKERRSREEFVEITENGISDVLAGKLIAWILER